jgi:hypothetical protein
VVTGNSLADFLLKGVYWGQGSEYDINVRVQTRWRDYETYFADTWRVTPRFTLNYGFRWAYLPNPFDQRDEIGNFVLSLYDPKKGATYDNGMIWPGTLKGLDVNNRSLVKNHPWDIAPRLGIAWDPTGKGKWSLRLGGGVFYNREAVSDVMNMGSNPPFRTHVTLDCCRPFDSIPTDLKFTGSQGLPAVGKVISAKTPGSYQWNLTVERELWKDAKLEVGYVANRGHHIPGWLFLNQVPVDKRVQFAIAELDEDGGTDGDILRPLYALTGTGAGPQVATRSFDSSYHSLQVYFVKRYSHNVSYQMSYTWSKLLATGYGLGHIGGNEVSDPYNIKYDKGYPQFHRPHLFTANGIYRTPGLQGQSQFVRGLLGDWETSIIFTANSGRMDRITCCTNFTGTRSNRPDQFGDSKGAGLVDNWFKTNVFKPPAKAGALGKSAMSQVQGPGINNFDFSFMKNFVGIPWFTEGAQLQFRAELYNAFNHTQFMLVNVGPDWQNLRVDPATGNTLQNYTQNNVNWGRISRIREPREIQLALKISW